VKRILEAVPSDLQFEYVETDEAHGVEACEQKYMDTTLTRDAISPPHKELQSVTGYHKCVKSDEDIHERSFSNEWQDAAEQGRSTQSDNEAEIRTDKESRIRQLSASIEQSDGTSSAGRCVRAEPMAITQGRHTVQREHIRHAAALRQQLIHVTEERDALILESERNATIAQAAKKQNDAFKVELEKLRAQKDALSLQFEIMRAHYEKEISQHKKDMHMLKTQRDYFVDEQDVLILRAQRTAEDLEAVKKTRDFLKGELENMRVEQKEAVTQLEEQLCEVRSQCDQLICERRVLIFRAERAARELEDLKSREALRLKSENQQNQCNDSAVLEKQIKVLKAELNKMTRERNAYILKVQLASRNRTEIQKEKDALALQAENCRCQGTDSAAHEEKVNALTAMCEKLKKEIRLQATRTRAMLDATNRDLDVAKRETETLRRQCQSIGMMKVHLNNVRAENNKMKREGDLMKKDIDALRLEMQNLSRTQETT
jgi:chromosome segregation ATPase